MSGNDILTAVFLWGSENNVSDSTVILRFTLLALDSLHKSTRGLTIPIHHWSRVTSAGQNGYCINVDPSDYDKVRFVISLISDVYNSLKVLKEKNLPIISNVIENLYNLTYQFRDIRNFFTHLDERLSDLQKHGMDGPCQINCGITLKNSAKNNFHLVLENDTIFFSDYKQAKEVVMNQVAFDKIFLEVQSIYSSITNHKNHATTYPPASSRYPIT